MVLNKEINELEQELEETLPKFVFRNDPDELYRSKQENATEKRHKIT